MKRTAPFLACLIAGWLFPLSVRVQGGEVSDSNRIELCKTLRENVVAITVMRQQEGKEEVLSRFSGIVLDRKGHIATVADALEKGGEVYVRFLDGRVLKACVIGTDSMTNIGVCKVKADRLLPVRPGPGEAPPVGTRVFAVGNPFGLHHSVSEGMISGTHRTLTGRDGRLVHGFLQTDAPVNPGDAGGLLADSKGRFQGMISSTYGRAPSFTRVRKMLEEMFRRMNTDPEFKALFRDIIRLFFGGGFESIEEGDLQQKLEQLGEKIREKFPDSPGHFGGENQGPGVGAHGINFAVPAHKVLEITKKLINHGKVVRGRIGVRVLTLVGAPYHRRKYGVPDDVEGVLVAALGSNGPADKAGLRRFDVIQSFEGEKIVDPVAIMERVYATPPGTRVKLKVWRRSEGTRTVEVVIGELK